MELAKNRLIVEKRIDSLKIESESNITISTSFLLQNEDGTF